MTKIVALTDLHLGVPQSRARVESLANKMAKLPRDTRAVCITGDILTLNEKELWTAMIAGGLTYREIEQRREISQELTDRWAPQLFAAIPSDILVFMIPGNADILSYNQLAETSGARPWLRFNDQKLYTNGLPVNILGAGAIAPDNKDAEDILQHNPWYGGVIKPQIYEEKLGELRFLTEGWRPADWAKTVLLTHMPALGHMDINYKGERQGSPAVLSFIREKKPLLHLAGHVHEGPFAGEKYAPWSVVDNTTVSVNAGGGFKHDGEPGTLALLIDMEVLAAGREEGRLVQAAAEAVVRI